MTKTNFVETKNVDSFVNEQGTLSVGENLFQQHKLSVKVPDIGKTDKGGWKYELHIIDLPQAFAEVSVNNINTFEFAGGYMLDYKDLSTDKINEIKWACYRTEGKNGEGFKSIRVSGINKKGDHLKRLARVLVIDSPEPSDIGKVKILKMGPSLFAHYKQVAHGDTFENIVKRNPHRCTMTIRVKEGLPYTELYNNVIFSDELTDAEMTKRVAMVPSDAITLKEVIDGSSNYFNPSDDVKTRILENAGFDLEAMAMGNAAKRIVDGGSKTDSEKQSEAINEMDASTVPF